MCDCNCTVQTVSDEPRWTGFVRCACKSCGPESPGGRQCNVCVHPVRRLIQLQDLDIPLPFADAIKLDVYCGDCWRHAHLMIRRSAGSRKHAKRKSLRHQDQIKVEDRSRSRSKLAHDPPGDGKVSWDAARGPAMNDLGHNMVGSYSLAAS